MLKQKENGTSIRRLESPLPPQEVALQSVEKQKFNLISEREEEQRKSKEKLAFQATSSLLLLCNTRQTKHLQPTQKSTKNVSVPLKFKPPGLIACCSSFFITTLPLQSAWILAQAQIKGNIYFKTHLNQSSDKNLLIWPHIHHPFHSAM